MARGTASGPITLTLANGTPAPGDWTSLQFNGAVGASFDNSGNYTGGSILENASVLYGGGGSIGAAVDVEASSPYLHDVTVDQSGSRGMHLGNELERLGGWRQRHEQHVEWRGDGLANGRACPTLQNSTIGDSGATGLSVGGYCWTTVQYVTVTNSSGDGLDVGTADSARTTIWCPEDNSGVGVSAWAWWQMDIDNSVIEDNGGDGVDWHEHYEWVFGALDLANDTGVVQRRRLADASWSTAIPCTEASATSTFPAPRSPTTPAVGCRCRATWVGRAWL